MAAASLRESPHESNHVAAAASPRELPEFRSARDPSSGSGMLDANCASSLMSLQRFPLASSAKLCTCGRQGHQMSVVNRYSRSHHESTPRNIHVAAAAATRRWPRVLLASVSLSSGCPPDAVGPSDSYNSSRGISTSRLRCARGGAATAPVRPRRLRDACAEVSLRRPRSRVSAFRPLGGRARAFVEVCPVSWRAATMFRSVRSVPWF